MRQPILYFVHDPMCSWCWGFAPAWQKISTELQRLPLEVRLLVGGLAPDSNEPMPIEQQQTIAKIWQRIQQQIPGTEFNFDFWQKNTPRRSTYPACRAVLAAKNQGGEFEQKMISAIQQAYYLEAKNPSDDEVLIELAEKTGLNRQQFSEDLNSTATQKQLIADIEMGQSLPINGFPSLAIQTTAGSFPIKIDYNQPEITLAEIKKHLS